MYAYYEYTFVFDSDDADGNEDVLSIDYYANLFQWGLAVDMQSSKWVNTFYIGCRAEL